ELVALTVPAEPQMPAQKDTDEISAQTLRVLVAEDNEVNQKIIRAMLRSFGIDPLIVNNGHQALEAVKERSFDLVFMDCQMPELDGLSATQHIRAWEQANSLQPVPVIAMTANAMEGDRENCLAAGMTDYTSKPVSRQSLQNLIKQWSSAH
ncbi:MAG: response regulator, partial [Pseudomonadales bacterium]|nr:response regulator [Pseudomonadales bacterium]